MFLDMCNLQSFFKGILTIVITFSYLMKFDILISAWVGVGMLMVLRFYCFMVIWFSSCYGFMALMLLWFYSFMVVWFCDVLIAWFHQIYKTHHVSRKILIPHPRCSRFCCADLRDCSVPIFSKLVKLLEFRNFDIYKNNMF